MVELRIFSNYSTTTDKFELGFYAFSEDHVDLGGFSLKIDAYIESDGIFSKVILNEFSVNSSWFFSDVNLFRQTVGAISASGLSFSESTNLVFLFDASLDSQIGPGVDSYFLRVSPVLNEAFFSADGEIIPWEGGLYSITDLAESTEAKYLDGHMVILPVGEISYLDSSEIDFFEKSVGQINAIGKKSSPLSYGIVDGLLTDDGGYYEFRHLLGTLRVSRSTGEFEFTPKSSQIESLAQKNDFSFQLFVSDGTTTEFVRLKLTAIGTNDFPIGDVSISGLAIEGQTLSASNNLSDADGLGNVIYTWYASGSDTAIGTGSSYILTQHEVGKTISVKAIYTDLGFAQETVASVATAVVLPLDFIAPTVFAFSPAKSTTGVALDSNIVLTFSEAIARGTGIIQIRSGSHTGTIVESFDAATSANLSISGATLNINPTNDLAESTRYFVTFTPGSVKDLADNSYAGTNTYEFTTITPPNATPRAIGFSIKTNEDTAIKGTLEGTDEDGNALTFAGVTGPTNGTLTINATTGAYTYTPNANFNGSDIFLFKVHDGIATSAVAIVLINVAPVTDITGHIYHWKNHSLLQGVQVSDGTTFATSGGNGNFRFNAANLTSALLAAELDVQGIGSAIDSSDALAALKIATGRNPNADGSPITPYQYIAADMNEDGVVTSADALAILKLSQGHSDVPSAKWLFVRESEDFWNETINSFTTSRKSVVYDKSIDVSTQSDVKVNLVAVLKGDVNGSWQAADSMGDLSTLDPGYFADLSNRLGSPQSQWGLIL